MATNALYQQKTAASSSLNMVLKDPTDTDVAIGGGGGMFTASNSENRRVVPENAGDRPVMKVVYVVLESQYQSSMTGAVKRINAGYYAAGTATPVPSSVQDTRVAQGFLEGSNTTPTHEMGQLMTTLRHCEANQKIMKVHDETMGKLIQQLGNTQ